MSYREPGNFKCNYHDCQKSTGSQCYHCSIYNPVCAGDPVTFTATPMNGGFTPSYQWQVNGANAGTNSPIFTYYPSNGDVVRCILTSSLWCVSAPGTSNSITMTVNSRPIPTLSGPTTVCAGTTGNVYTTEGRQDELYLGRLCGWTITQAGAARPTIRLQ